jgi:transcriptional regulator with XRE-family HTH domain
MSEIASRFKQIREDKKMTITAVSVAIGEKRQRLQDVELGNQKIPEDIIVKYIEYFDIDANWLLTGKGEMYRSGNAISDLQADKIVELYDSLSQSQQKEILSAIEEKKRFNQLIETVEQLQAKVG